MWRQQWRHAQIQKLTIETPVVIKKVARSRLWPYMCFYTTQTYNLYHIDASILWTLGSFHLMFLESFRFEDENEYDYEI